MSIEAMKKAYDALLGAANCIEYPEIVQDIEQEAKDLLKAIKQADHIPDPTKMIECATCGYPLAESERAGLVEINGKMHKPWVGLTDDDIKPLCDEWRIMFGSWAHDFARAIEAKLKELNT